MTKNERARKSDSPKLRVVVLTTVALMLAVSGHLTPCAKADNATEVHESYDLSFQALPDGTLDSYLAYAALNNPGLKASYQNWRAALEKLPQASALPDPTVSYGYFIENVETRVGPQNHKFGLKQSFPWFGTPGNKREIADEAAGAAYQKFQSQKLRLFYQVKAAYYDYYILGREIEITRDNMELLIYWESVARTRYKAGLTGYHNVIKAQVELGKLENRLTSMEELKTPLASRLRATVNLPDSFQVPFPDSIPQIALAFDRDVLRKVALDGSPDVKGIEHLVQREESAVRLARKSYLPDFAVGLDYIDIGESANPDMRGSGKDAWTVGVSMSLPIWFGKNRAKVNEARARRLEAEYHLADAKNDLAALVDKIFYEYKDAVREIELYRGGLIAKAEQSLNATFAAYRVGETDFLNVIDSQRELLNLQLQLEYALGESSRKLAELEMLVGQNLNNDNEAFKKGEIQ